MNKKLVNSSLPPPLYSSLPFPFHPHSSYFLSLCSTPFQFYSSLPISFNPPSSYFFPLCSSPFPFYSSLPLPFRSSFVLSLSSLLLHSHSIPPPPSHSIPLRSVSFLFTSQFPFYSSLLLPFPSPFVLSLSSLLFFIQILCLSPPCLSTSFVLSLSSFLFSIPILFLPPHLSMPLRPIYFLFDLLHSHSIPPSSITFIPPSS
jgi:hypothetical protein